MSRAGPPFPTSNGSSRRARSPANGLPNSPFIGTGPQTPPLAISRPPRPTTPSSIASSSKAAPSPSRPTRSDLRPRQPSQTSSRTAVDYSSADTSSERPRYRAEGSATHRDGPQLSPTSPSVSAVAAAFHSAGASRRAFINGDAERIQEREREIAREKERQRRIRDKVQGRRTNGKARTGDIDGAFTSPRTISNRQHARPKPCLIKFPTTGNLSLIQM